jgi:hypothetical protein
LSGDLAGGVDAYTGGRYFDQLQKIISAYRISENKISHAHFELSDTGVGPVELFRIPDQSADCSSKPCDFFVLIAADYSVAPLVIPCQFGGAGLAHLFNPDGSRFYGFEFSCEGGLLQVKVTSDHFMTNFIKPRVETGK